MVSPLRFCLLECRWNYVSIVKWPYPKIKDLLSVIATPAFAIVVVFAWLSIRGNWSKERHDQAIRIPIVAAILMSIIWLANHFFLWSSA
jgi:hypothetical protein